MLLDYAVTKMSYFDEYLDAASRAKNIRENGITTFFRMFPNVSLPIKQNLLQQHLLQRHGWSNPFKG